MRYVNKQERVMDYKDEAKRLNALKRQAEARQDWAASTEIQKQISILAWDATGLPRDGRFCPEMVKRFNNR